MVGLSALPLGYLLIAMGVKVFGNKPNQSLELSEEKNLKTTRKDCYGPNVKDPVGTEEY